MLIPGFFFIGWVFWFLVSGFFREHTVFVLPDAKLSLFLSTVDTGSSK